ncbi:hypothetical protein BpJC7_15960 [Weizmannia acidilactici]|uniref:Uncharacterized protein n=1 Tax=Weizmannia acidilactici TaxID=2607726 RepID=A0A5J4JDX8_9BACI|nr:hypothetical protein [Weizmannia acidilactici]GER70293.1 hypothetical protein BpJC7_15960 [Weizmannia acidilactici]GER74896.1 hypothetical protein BpPP18_29630 [Weizmannia acidilactici]
MKEREFRSSSQSVTNFPTCFAESVETPEKSADMSKKSAERFENRRKVETAGERAAVPLKNS